MQIKQNSMFEKYSKYYEILNQDKNYLNECIVVDYLLKNYGHNIERILEVGSGTGTHLNILKNNYGYNCTGLEISAEMCSKAKEINNIRLHNCDLLNFNADTNYDGIISLFHVINYITKTEDLIATFKKVSEILTEDGVFVFDSWHSPAVNNLKPSNRVRIKQSDDLKITRSATFTENILKSSVDVHFNFSVENSLNQIVDSFEEKHPMRYFTYNEIELLAIMAGLEISECLTFPELETPSRENWNVVFILKKV